MKIITEISPYMIKLAGINNEKLEYFEVIPNDDCLNNIYLGKILEIHKGLNNAFVSFDNKIGYLDIEKSKSILISQEKWPVKKNDIVIVQVKKVAQKTKKAKLTMDIEIKSDNLIFFPFNNRKFFSKKINVSEKKRISEIIKDKRLKDKSFLFREKIINENNEVILDSCFKLIKKWDLIYNKSKYEMPEKIIYKESLEGKFADYVDIGDVLINDPNSIFTKNNKFRISDEIPLFDKYNLREEPENLCKNIHEFNKSRIIIEELESLTAIDVDTGSYKGNENVNKSLFETNVDAVDNIARFLRLRNIQGAIIIDFINLKDKNKRDELRQRLAYCMKKDFRKSKVFYFTNLGFLELEREGKRARLSEIIYNDKGNDKLSQTYLFDKIFWFLERNRKNYYNSNCLLYLKEQYRNYEMQKEFGEICKNFNLKITCEFKKQEEDYVFKIK